MTSNILQHYRKNTSIGIFMLKYLWKKTLIYSNQASINLIINPRIKQCTIAHIFNYQPSLTNVAIFFILFSVIAHIFCKLPRLLSSNSFRKFLSTASRFPNSVCLARVKLPSPTSIPSAFKPLGFWLSVP